MAHFFKNSGYLFIAGIILLTYPVKGQPSFNYAEDKIVPYQLPDPLRLPNGKNVTSAQQWTSQKRPAILSLFATDVYGKYPGKPNEMYFRVTSVDKTALAGKATRKQITVFFNKSPEAPSMDILMYLPNHIKGPIPVFTGLNFYGNHCIHTDPGITLSTRWTNNNSENGVTNNKASEASRGMQASRWQVEELIDRGYGIVTAYYGDLEPDHAEGWKTGIRSTLKNTLHTNEQEWGAIGTWAWGLSRMMDYLESDKDIDTKRVVVTGHSRLGKAALWAGANDTRFAIIIANESGEGGAALARRNYGETIQRINTDFPHWFSPKFKSYNDKAENLPVDQHMLLALMAPRPLYIASAEDDKWADPKGEFLGAKYAEPIYKLFGKKGLGADEMPGINQPVGETIGYHIRNGKHDINAYDWQQYLKFADKHFNNTGKSVTK